MTLFRGKEICSKTSNSNGLGYADYYPFGMLQPQRGFEAEMSDSSGFVLDSPYVFNEQYDGDTVPIGWASTNGHSTLSVSGGNLVIAATDAWSGGVKSFTTVPGKTYRVRYSADFGSSPYAIMIQVNSIWNAYSPYYPGGVVDYTFTATATTGTVTVASTYSAATFSVDYITIQQVTPDTIAAARYWKEGYRFYYNTQERVKEIQEQHQTAPFWEYDPRAVLRWNTDPKYEAGVSPYVINVDNPIMYSDPEGDCATCPQEENETVQPSPAGLLYEAYLGIDAAVFNTMARGAELLGLGKSGVSVRKETEYGNNGEILGNKIVEKPRNGIFTEIKEAALDLVAAIPGKPSSKAVGPLMLSKPLIGKANAVQVVKFIQGTGSKAKEVSVNLPKGFKEVQGSGKAKVFSDGKKYISPDLDGHKGGIWKMAGKEKDLWKKETRTGTYNADLTKKVDN